MIFKGFVVLIWFVIAYMMVSVAIGLLAAKRVHNVKDYAVASRNLPLPIVIATVFATWFGAEVLFGVSATFVQEGFNGLAADPFGASMCLIISGLFFSTKLYKLNIITLGDFYRIRYNRTVELLTTIAIVISYLGWVAAQISAMGLIFNIVTHGALSQPLGMLVGIIIVLTYTTLGGMRAIAILDFVQMIVIIGGLLYIANIVAGMTGGIAPVIAKAEAEGKLTFFPENADIWVYVTFIGGWMTMMLGSIPQQDVFQRITSAKSAKVALWGSLIGATLYFCVSFIPMFIAYAATMIDPTVFGGLAESDSQRVLPALVLQYTPLLAQVIFFGAVISAIMSTSSATLLAPSVTFAENFVKGFMPNLTDKDMLKVMRLSLVGFSFCVLVYALNSKLSIFGMVESAYKVTLAGAFVPLVFGAFWRKATSQGALLAIVAGIGSWIGIDFLFGDEILIPGQLLGLVVSIGSMILGSLMPQTIFKESC
ncbi:MAG: SSS family solute:Na+ symporter [Methylophilaceae bacterium]|jgi:SSS family solute:Na+ symporter